MEEATTTAEPTEREIANTVNPTGVAEQTAGNDFLSLVRARNLARYGESPELPKEPEAKSVEEQPITESNPVQIEVPEEANDEVIETVQEDPLEAKRRNKAENMKNLRNALKSSRDRVSELEAQIASKDKELEKLSEIDTLREELQAKEERLQKLKQYEDVVSLYGTEGFKEKFYDSVDELRSQAVDIARDYGVPETVLDQAFKLTNQRQLNEFLGRYFDTFAVQDVRGLIKEAQRIMEDRQTAEAEPAKAREILLTTIAKRKEAERATARENLNTVGTDAWNEMAAAYSNKDSGVSLLQEKEGNKGHNSIRQAILQGASKEYAKTLAVLAENGLREIPPTVARAMASRYQLGEAAAHAIVQAENLYKENLELKAELKKLNDYQRPLTSGASVSTTKVKTDSDLSGRDLARFIYSKAASNLSR